jgi:hypothetical protein
MKCSKRSGGWCCKKYESDDAPVVKCTAKQDPPPCVRRTKKLILK